jgi:hypothetical protein
MYFCICSTPSANGEFVGIHFYWDPFQHLDIRSNFLISWEPSFGWASNPISIIHEVVLSPLTG